MANNADFRRDSSLQAVSPESALSQQILIAFGSERVNTLQRRFTLRQHWLRISLQPRMHRAILFYKRATIAASAFEGV